jgi:hypothetical protein
MVDVHGVAQLCTPISFGVIIVMFVTYYYRCRLFHDCAVQLRQKFMEDIEARGMQLTKDSLDQECRDRRVSLAIGFLLQN